MGAQEDNVHPPCRIVAIDDHPLFVAALAAALEGDARFEIVGDAGSERDAMELLARTRADLVLVDIRLPGGEGVTFIRRIGAAHPELRVVVLSGSDDTEDVQLALRAGASGYIVKTVEPSDLPDAILRTLASTVYEPIGARRQQPAGAAPALTPREADVLRGVARGLTNAEIARSLWLAEKTVKFHLTNIYRKIGVRNRTQAARAAFQLGLAETGTGEGPPRERTRPDLSELLEH